MIEYNNLISPNTSQARQFPYQQKGTKSSFQSVCRCLCLLLVCMFEIMSGLAFKKNTFSILRGINLLIFNDAQDIFLHNKTVCEVNYYYYE